MRSLKAAGAPSGRDRRPTAVETPSPDRNTKAVPDCSTESARGRVPASQVDPLAAARGIASALFIMAVLLGSMTLGGILAGLPGILLIIGAFVLFVGALVYGATR